jgi:threonine/homoserine/homoserine lactone efflux protein
VLPLLAAVAVISISGVMIPGPMFAVNVAKSYRSAWTGARMAVGHLIIEIPLILLIYFGFARFFENTAVRVVLSLAGGAMIIWMGVSMFRARAEVIRKGKDLSYNAVAAGIITSGLNPYFFLWWATAGSAILMKFLDYGTAGLIAFIIVHWLCDLFWLSFVSVLINRTQNLWGQKVQEGIFVVCSLILAGFGSWFIVTGVQLLV